MSVENVDNELAPAPAPVSAPAEHPGIAQLYAVLAYGEVQAFYRLSKEAEMAPTMAGRLAIAAMAGAEIGHYEQLAEELVARGLDPVEAMVPYHDVIDRYHSLTSPVTWLEVLVKAHIGDGLAADFYTEVATALPDGPAQVVRSVMAHTGHSDFVVEEVRAAIAAEPYLKGPLTLWGRRLLWEAIIQAQHVLGTRDELTDLLFDSGLTGVAEFFSNAQTRHEERMADLGL